MPVQPIRHFPEPVLRKPCETVREFDENLAKLILDLVQTMKSQPHGIGIAAPQIGVSKRVAVVDVSPRIPGAQRLVLVNPQFIDCKDPRASREGCMSLPDYTANLKRYETIELRWLDEKGKTRQKTFTGLEAVCIQHEVDHLEGKLFIDRVASLKRDMIPRPKSLKSL